MTRWWPLLAVLAAVVLTAATSDAATRGSCDRHSRGAELRTSKVVVFFRGAAEDESGRRFYVCRRPAGKPIRIGTDLPEDDQYGSDSTVTHLRAAGSYAGALITEGAASATACSKYAGDPCPPILRFLRVIDTRSRARTDVPVETFVRRLVLSPGGAVAWLDPGGVLFASDLKTPPREIDRGAISGLRFSGLTLHWMRDGEPHAATISGGA